MHTNERERSCTASLWPELSHFVQKFWLFCPKILVILLYKKFYKGNDFFELQMTKTNQVYLSETITDELNYMDSESKKASYFLDNNAQNNHSVPLLLTWKYVAASRAALQACRPRGGRGCHNTPRFWQIS